MHSGTLRNLAYDIPSAVKHYGRAGHWRWDFAHDTHSWSSGLHSILGISNGLVGPDYALLFGLIHPDDCPPTVKPGLVRRSETVPPSIFRIVRPDSTICPVMSRVEVTTAPDGRHLRAHVLLADISDPAMLARAEAEQQQRTGRSTTAPVHSRRPRMSTRSGNFRPNGSTSSAFPKENSCRSRPYRSSRASAAIGAIKGESSILPSASSTRCRTSDWRMGKR